jgi:hypothetical protein
MWALVKSLLMKWGLFKLLLKAFPSLAWLLPLAFILKAIGLPALIVLAIVAIPLVIILVIVGLPMLFVAVTGAIILAGIFFMLSLGIAVLKLAIPFIIIYFILKWVFKNKKGSDPATE